MIGRARMASDLGFEAFGTACGLAVIAGALSLAVPTLAPVLLPLAALAVAGWASRQRRAAGPGPATGSRLAPALALALLAGMVGLFLDPPPALATERGFLLGLALVPLWATGRRTRAKAAPREVP